MRKLLRRFMLMWSWETIYDTGYWKKIRNRKTGVVRYVRSTTGGNCTPFTEHNDKN